MRRTGRLSAAVAAGRLTGALSRRLGRGGGTTLPGDVARAIDGGVLAALAAQARCGAVLVSGTNGKTTTASLIRAGARRAGWRVVANPSGANLVFGLTAAAVQAASPAGRLDTDWLVFEVDELSLPRAVREVRPRCVTLLNLSRDQLDRAFELDEVAERLRLAVADLPEGSVCVANADDPIVASLTAGCGDVRYFGIDSAADPGRALGAAADASRCPRCGAPLDYATVVYAHAGHYRCDGCGLTRPQPTWSATEVAVDGLASVRFTLRGPDGEIPVHLPIGGIVNVANAAAALATLAVMGADPRDAAASLQDAEPAFGRGERVALEGAAVRLLLAKNPAGLDEAIRAAMGTRAPALALGLNDGVADGRDVSWIWDAELERLAAPDAPPRLIVSGTRAADLLVRLHYAGVDDGRIQIAEPPAAALDACLAAGRAGGGTVAALLTYTAALAWYRELTRRGAVGPYWERR